MKQINSIDQIIFNSDIENIFKTILDLTSYKEWFPDKFKLEIISNEENYIGSRIKISYLGIEFIWEIIKIEKLSEIIVSYSGAYKGLATWYFSNLADGVKVMFEVELEIKNPFILFASFFVNMNEFHSKQMVQLFNNLETYLNTKYPNEKTRINNIGNIQPPTFTITGDRFGT